MVPVIAQIMAFIQLALKAAPTVKQVYDDAHTLIDEMFKTKMITKEQQAAAHNWADDHQANVLAAAKAGKIPLEMQVDEPPQQQPPQQQQQPQPQQQPPQPQPAPVTQ